MKKLIVMLIFVLPLLLSAQNFGPPKHQFHWGVGGTGIFLSSDSSYFKQEKIMLGYHWGDTRKISTSERINMFDSPRNWTAYYIDTGDIESNCNIILKPEEYTHAHDSKILNVRAIQYEPTIRLDASNPDRLVNRSGDRNKQVFGFMNVRGRILSDSNNLNFHRLIIDSLSLINQVVLSEPWPSDKFTIFGKSVPGKKAWVIDSFLCRLIYLSINLRRGDSVMNSDTVLKIELPYKITGSSVTYYIRFDSIPCSKPGSTFLLDSNRGRARKDTVSPNDSVRAVYITKNMLPPNNEDITISAFFRCDEDTVPPFPLPDLSPWGNHELKEIAPETSKIDSLKIKITYLGGSPLMIDWVRLETPHAQRFLRGTYDETIINHVQDDLDKFIADSFLVRNIKLFRYNTIVEGGLQNWIAEKYFNEMIGNISTNETGVVYPAHYEWYVNPPDRWFGTWDMQSNVSAPYSQKVYEPDLPSLARTMAIFNGYNGKNAGVNDTGRTNAHYETYLVNKESYIPNRYFLDHPDSITLYEQVTNSSNNHGHASFLAAYEGSVIYVNYFKASSRGFLFSDKFWWHQGFPLINWGSIDVAGIDNPNRTHGINFATMGHRPLTGEEFRLHASLGIIIGAKGLLYDGGSTGKDDTTKSRMYDGNCISDVSPSFERTNLEALSDSAFLNSELAGPDFFRTSDEILNFNNRLISMDTLAKYLDRPRDRIYLGRKSNRLEMRKLHDWVRANDSLLMRLRLVSWLAKGYKCWYIQDTARFGTNNIFSKFIASLPDSVTHYVIDTSKFYTRQIYNGGAREPWDSIFTDITILRDKEDSLMTSNVWYLGLSNRRTNCLVHTIDTLSTNNSVIDNSLKFYSTAEFDQFVQFGGRKLNGDSMPASYWQNLWWQRAGVREIYIPFKFRNSNKSNDWTTLRVTELGYDDTTLNKILKRSDYLH